MEDLNDLDFDLSESLKLPESVPSSAFAHLAGELNLTVPKFLIADGNKPIRLAIRDMLKKNGYKNYEFAETGPQAIKIIKKNMVNFIISDWHISQISGIDLLKIIKGDPKYFVVGFIMISADKSMKKVIYAIEEGADGFILKPFTEDGLLGVVKRAIDEKLTPDQTNIQINNMTRNTLRKNYDKALKIGYNILKDKTNSRVARISGECFYQKREYEKASIMLKESLKEGHNSKTLQLLGKICLETGKDEEAINYFKQALSHNPINQDSKIDLIHALLKRGQDKQANEMAKNLIETESSYLHSIEIAKLYLKFDSIENINKYLSDIEPIPETVHVFYDCAIKLGKNGKYSESIEILEKCDKAFPESYFIQFNLGVMYYQTKKYKQAIDFFNNTLKLKPDHIKAKQFLDYIKKALESA